jgi:hypothetical protein
MTASALGQALAYWMPLHHAKRLGQGIRYMILIMYMLYIYIIYESYKKNIIYDI